MELTNSFVVPAGIDAAWVRLLDVAALAPCLPGATLTDSDGETFTGTVKIKLGPVNLTYGGSGRFVSADAQAHRAVIEASGKDARGNSTARATIHTQLVAEADDRTRAEVSTDLAITGRPAQFGRGVMEDVAGRIIDQFAANLAASMGASTTTPDADAGQVEEPQPAVAAPAAEALDLVGAAGVPVLKRLAPVAAVLAIVGVIVWWLRRSRDG